MLKLYHLYKQCTQASTGAIMCWYLSIHISSVYKICQPNPNTHKHTRLSEVFVQETSFCHENSNFIDQSEHNGHFTLKRQNEAVAVLRRLTEDAPASSRRLSSGEWAESACKSPNLNTGEGFTAGQPSHPLLFCSQAVTVGQCTGTPPGVISFPICTAVSYIDHLLQHSLQCCSETVHRCTMHGKGAAFTDHWWFSPGSVQSRQLWHGKVILIQKLLH